MKEHLAITLFPSRRNTSRTPCGSRDPCLVDNIPVLGDVDSFQDDRGIRRAVYRLDTRHRSRSPVSATTVVIARSWSSFDAKTFSFRCRRKPFVCGRRAKPLSCRRVALFYSLRVTRVVRPSVVRRAFPIALPRTSRPPPSSQRGEPSAPRRRRPARGR